MSPVMQNAAFRKLDLDYHYELRSVPREMLGSFVETELRRTAVRGGNVTIPHKEKIRGYLDEMDPLASSIGAVNTIVNNSGSLTGYNTDVIGAGRALEEKIGSLEGMDAVLLGAGGAAKAVGYYLVREVSELRILNRTLLRGRELAENLKEVPKCEAKVTSHVLKEKTLEEALEGADILVNSTPLGMAPNVEGTPVDGGLLKPGLLVFDLVYNPPKTRLLREAEEAGAETLSGVSMLVYQGVEAFRLWTGRDPPVEVMINAVEEALGGN
jgi:shikimate dehydrogenase